MNKGSKIRVLIIVILLLGIIPLLKIDRITEIREVTHEGIVVSVEDVQEDEDRYTIKLRLQKENGSSFGEQEQIDEISLTAIEGETFGWRDERS